MRKLFLTFISLFVLSLSYAQDFKVPAQYEKILQDTDRYAVLDENGNAKKSIDDLSSNVGKIIEEFVPVFRSKRQKAVFLNDIGYAYYEKKDFNIACHFFEYAYHTDNTYKYPAYNFACAYTLLTEAHSKLPMNDYDSPFAYIVGSRFSSPVKNWLQKAIALDANYKTKMRTDSDFEYFYHEPWFIVLSGADIKTSSGMIDLLSSVKVWYGPKPGVYPQNPELYFQKDGTLTVTTFDQIESFGWTTVTGTYTVHDGYFMLHYDNKSYKGILEKGDEDRYFLDVDFGYTPHTFFTVELDVSA